MPREASTRVLPGQHWRGSTLFFLHGQIVPDTTVGSPEGTPRGLFVEVVRPGFEQPVARGRIGAWGISGIGVLCWQSVGPFAGWRRAGPRERPESRRVGRSGTFTP